MIMSRVPKLMHAIDSKLFYLFISNSSPPNILDPVLALNFVHTAAVTKTETKKLRNIN